MFSRRIFPLQPQPSYCIYDKVTEVSISYNFAYYHFFDTTFTFDTIRYEHGTLYGVAARCDLL